MQGGRKIGRCEEEERSEYVWRKKDRKLRGRKKIRICKEEERSKDAMRKISHGSGYFPHTYQVVGSHTSPPPPNPIEINQELIMFPMGVRD